MDTNIPFVWDAAQSIEHLWGEACLDPDFLTANNIAVTTSKEDEKEARAIVFQTPSAPARPTTPGAALAYKRLLSRYDFSFQDDAARMRSYITARLLDLSESEKESIALSALEKLGKIADVGLFETKISIDVNNKSREELENDLHTLVARYTGEVYAVN